MYYDIIGDVHGHADHLARLLQLMEYEEFEGVWRHRDRMAIFVGDFIDRGCKQLDSVGIVRRMVAAGSALAVMGNHEFNAIAWWEPDPAHPGDFLRSHKSETYRKQHECFLDEAGSGSALHREIIQWFYTLPLWLDLPELRVVHACWHPVFMDYLRPMLQPGLRVSKQLMTEGTRKPPDSEKYTPQTSVFKACDAILKGLEIALPYGLRFADKEGTSRKEVRLRWWDPDAFTSRRAAICDDDLRRQLPDEPIPEHLRIGYRSNKPVFFGHYWFSGKPHEQFLWGGLGNGPGLRVPRQSLTRQRARRPPPMPPIVTPNIALRPPQTQS
jgi:hypothetical protein